MLILICVFKPFSLIFSLHFVSSQERNNLNGRCCLCLLGVTETTVATVSSIAATLATLLFFVMSWNLIDVDSDIPLVKACLEPDDIYKAPVHVSRWWILWGIATSFHCLGIILSALLYIWLKRKEKRNTLVNSEVTNFLCQTQLRDKIRILFLPYQVNNIFIV